MGFILFLFCVTTVAVCIVLDVREEKQKARKMSDLEAALEEKNALLRQMTAPKQVQ